jgi:NADPH:quinone reductase-like Zn-dependent oxidoreductase
MQGFSLGDGVFGMIRFPSFGENAAYAEYVAAPASDLARKPVGVDHVRAAGAPMSGLTAWQFLIELGHNEPNPLQPEMHRPVPLNGKTVLVNGAAGGVGHLAVQLAKWKGARVITVASTAQESFLRDLGADEFIDYTKSRPYWCQYRKASTRTISGFNLSHPLGPVSPSLTLPTLSRSIQIWEA